MTPGGNSFNDFPEIVPTTTEIKTEIEKTFLGHVSLTHTTECLYFTTGPVPHLTHGYLGPPEFTPQHASRSVQPLWRSTRLQPTDRHDTHTHRGISVTMEYLHSVHAIQWWPGGVMVSVLARETKGRGFDSRPFHFQVTTLGKLFTHMCLCHQAV